MKLVAFKDGKYGVRRWFFGYEYLTSSLNWFPLRCLDIVTIRHSFEEAVYFRDALINRYELKKDKGEVVK